MWSSTAIRTLLIALDGFVALSAIAGGIALATGLEDGRFAVELLRGTPIGSYLIPGLILGAVVGGTATVAAAAALCWPRVMARTTALAGMVLMGWIAGEVLLLPAEARSWVEAGYFAVGLLMACFGCLARQKGFHERHAQ